MNEIIRNIETIRHGDKEGDRLSEKGREQAREKAKEYYQEIIESLPGTVFYLIPSIVQRAVETRDVIEEELRDIASGNKDVVFISVQDRDGIKQASGDFSKKYVITELQPSTALGFKEHTKYIPAWNKYANMFNKNEFAIASVWAARQDETEELAKDFSVDPENIKPSEFVETPEEHALKVLRLTRRLGQLTERYFPDHDYKCVQVGHAALSDIGTLPVLGYEINYSNYRNLLGGQPRKPLETASFLIKGNEVFAKYRDHQKTIEKSLEEIITNLEKASKVRRQEWGRS